MTDFHSTSSSSTRRARSRRAAPRGARLALCLAFVVALGAARPAEAFKWRWWKWKAIAAHHSKSPDDTSMKHVGHMKHMGGMTSGGDSECDDCGTWWRAKQWREGSWWGKHCRRDDGWKPGTGLRAGKCMVSQCGWQLKKCRWDMTCRESVQCAIGAWGEARKGHRHVRVSRLSRKARGTRVPRVLLFRESAFWEHESVDANTRSSVARFLLGHVFRFSCAHRFSRFFFRRRVRHGRRRRVPRVRVQVRTGQPQRRHRGPLLLRPGQELHARDVDAPIAPSSDAEKKKRFF
jgi:hypothetical protein